MASTSAGASACGRHFDAPVAATLWASGGSLLIATLCLRTSFREPLA